MIDNGQNVRVNATDWNSALRAASCLKILPGPGIRFTRTKNGTTVSAHQKDWVHPWKVTCWFSDDGETPGWFFRVAPGFVNGEPPTVAGTAPPEEADAEDLTILEIDRMRVNGFRPVGSDGSRVPPFFRKFNIEQQKAAPSVTLANFDSFDVGNIAQAAETIGDRKLRAFDVFVTVARATFRMDATITGNILLGSLLEYNVVYDTNTLLTLGIRPRLNQAPTMNEPEPPDFSQRLGGIVGDDGLDRMLVATVYFLSPKESPSDEPDGSWSAYVEQKCFWNVSHAPRNAVPINLPQLGSVAGIFALTSRYTLAPAAVFAAAQAEIQRIAAALFNSTSNRGAFWTT
jgi:hypothetical protein